MESELSEIAGVYATEVGYSGGHSSNPSYEQVCSGKTGHTEVVKVEFDQSKLSYKALLGKFLGLHNPFASAFTSRHSGQYKSVIFYTSESQEKQAREVIDALQKEKKQRVITQIEPLKKFWKAEEYHQKYYKKNGLGYCGKF